MPLSERERAKLEALAARYAKRIHDCQTTLRSVRVKRAEDPTSARAQQWAQREAELEAQIEQYEAHLRVAAVQGIPDPRAGDHVIQPAAGQVGVAGSEV